MKKFTQKLLAVVFCLLSTVAVQGQTVILGTGTATNGTTTASPINQWYRSSHGQMVYTAAELNAAGISGAGTITHFGFYIAGAPTNPLPNYTIKMKNTTATNVATYDGVGLTTVHNIASYAPTAGGWSLLQLNTPFLWNGVDNILVDVCFDMVSNYTSSGQVYIYTPAVPSGFIYSRSDTQNQCGLAASSVSSDKPQAQLSFVPSSPIDLGVNAILQPVSNSCYSAAETFRVRVKAYGTATVDFSVNNLVISSSVAGVNPVTFPPLTITSGTLAPNQTFDTTITTTYNMSAAGSYTFNAKATIATDGYAGNDSVAPLTINVSPGVASVDNNNLCGGSSVNLTLTGSTGTIQWQSSTDGGATWVNETGGGSTTAAYTTVPATTTMYRALICGTLPSNEVTVTVTVVPPPTASGDTRCGEGVVNLNATGSPTIQWFASSFGGAPLTSGTTYSPYITGSTTFYAQGSNGTSSNLGRTNNASNSGSLFNNYGVVFNATVGFTLNSVKIYPVGTGNITIGLLNSANNSINSRTITVTGATGQPMNVYVGFYITPGTNYKLVLSSYSGVSALYYDGSGNTFPYTAAGTASITSGWNGTGTSTSYYYFYDWNVLTGCVSNRTPVTGTVTPADTVIVSSSASAVCSGTSVTMMTNSNDPDYNYVWSPATGLNQTTGSSVVANPTIATTYTVTATNTTSGCQTTTTKYLQIGTTPVVTAVSTPSEICNGASVQLSAGSAGVMGYVSVGTGTTTNSSTGYPAPYGNFYWGARHQMLIRASELSALGFTAGSALSSVGFDVTATNTAASLVGFTIKMGHTTLTTLTTMQSGLTTVKPAANYTPTVGWNQHTFTAPFVWDGSSNVIVETCFNNSSYTNNASMRYSTTPFTSTIYYRSDATGVCTSTSTPTTSSNRPNMRFYVQEFDYLWSPSATLSADTIANPVGTPTVNTSYVVQVTNPNNGCAATDTIAVQVNQLPVVGLANSAGVCMGDTLTLSAAPGFTSYNWTTSETTQSIGVTAAGSYTVVVVDTNGCTNADTIQVVINPAPTVAVSPDVSQCGGTTTLTSTASSGVNYSWNNGAFSPSILVSQSGTYVLTVTNAYGCTDRDTAVVAINDIPMVALGSDTSFCPGGSIQLTAVTDTGATYAWSTTESTQSINVTTTGQYSVTVTSSAGCVNADTVVVGLSPEPIAAAGVDQSLCSGQGAVLTASGGNFYTWSTGANTPSIFVTPGVTTSYVVLVENVYGCADLDTVTVIVNSSPVASAGSNQSICEGGTVTLSATGGTSYNWSNGETTSSITVSPLVTTTYNVVVADANTCTSSASVTVTVNSIPNASAGSDRAICEGTSTTLNGAGGTSYDWSPATGLSSTSVANPTAAPQVTTTYTVSVTAAGGCTAVDNVVVEITPLPVASFTNTVTGPTASFANMSTNEVNYVWDFGDNSPANSSENPTHQYFDNGTYVVYLTVTNGCGTDTASTTVEINGIGIRETELEANTMIYPNPTKGVFTFSMKDEKSDTVVLRLMDINGQLIDDVTFTNFGTELRKDYDISGLAKGVYYLHIVKDNHSIMKRVILN